MAQTGTVLIIGSAPGAVVCADWPRTLFSSIVAINNAWRIRDDWDHHIAPDDFPADRMPPVVHPRQTLIGSHSYVPANNRYGGIVYAGGTMAFTAGYWALARLRPAALVFVGCDMIYPAQGKTHFYGAGTADPLRNDVTLRNLEAKSARLMVHAARQGCVCLRASEGPSRLIFPSVAPADLLRPAPLPIIPNTADFTRAQALEKRLGYFVESGRYWEERGSFEGSALDAVDRLWMACARQAQSPLQASVA